MASQTLQASQSTRLRMRLAKFSFANVFAGSIGPIPWTHLSSQNDLWVVLDPFEITNSTGAFEKRYRFKILQDPNVQEDLDLSLLAYEARKAIDQAQTFSIPCQQPSIAIIVKAPCVAMRYPLPDGQVRRFQVRYFQEEDYYETLRIFSGVKLPFVDAGRASDQPTIHTSNAQPTAGSSAINYAPVYTGNVHTSSSQTSLQPSAITHFANPSQIQRTVAPDLVAVSSYQPPFVTQITPCTTSGPSNNQADAPTPQWPSAYISTYIPRPSTAPELTTRQSIVEMPPKRTLPFQRKTERSIRSKTSKTVDNPQHANQVQANEPLPLAEIPAQLQDGQLEQATASKPRKRAAARPKKAPIVKASRTSTRRKSEAPKSQEVTAFSTKESIPQHDSHGAGESTATAIEIDTQALLEKAEHIKASRSACKTPSIIEQSIKLPTVQKMISKDISTILQHPMQTRASARHLSGLQATMVQVEKATSISSVPPLAHDSYLHKVGTADHQEHTKSTTSHTPSVDHSPSYHPKPTVPSPLPQISTQPGALPIISNPEFNLPANLNLPSKSTAPSEPASNHTTAIDFSLLSPEDQHVALEEFIVDAINDEKFLKLCQSLDGVWQRIFVQI